MTALDFPNTPTLGQKFNEWEWDGSKWILTAAPVTPSTNYIIGEIREFATAACVPAQWLICDGSGRNRNTYAALFAKIGTVYGAGDGTTTFGIPNLVDRFTRGSAAGGSNAGATGGSADSTLPSHYHGLAAGSATGGGTHNHGLPQGVGFYGDQGGNPGYIGGSGLAGHYTWNMGKSVWYDAPNHTHPLGGTTDWNGASASGTNIPPYTTVVKAIYAGA